MESEGDTVKSPDSTVFSVDSMLDACVDVVAGFKHCTAEARVEKPDITCRVLLNVAASRFSQLSDNVMLSFRTASKVC